MKVYGIIGYPLTHSFSKKYFTAKFETEGLSDLKYELFPVSTIHELKNIIRDNPYLRGLNVTIPYKQLVLDHLHSGTAIPFGVRACNCIKIVDEKMVGYNTDITGFEQSLLPLVKNNYSNALILGNGGAAEAVKYVLRKININYKTVSRHVHDGSHLNYATLDEKAIKENHLIINTTPLGTYPDSNEYPDIPYQYLTSEHLLFDLVYNPEKTKFLEKGETQGAAIKNGLEMLMIQAEESWKIWNED